MTRSTSPRKSDAPAAAQVRAYIDAFPPATRRALRQLRATVRAAAPRAVEGFSYRMPCVRLEGRPLVWYAGFTQHCSLFPITASIRKAHAAALKGYHTSTGTVRFPLGQPMPVALVRRLVKARIAELQR
jgi:uncharacterized protein YdhG (YjbR/CyaY superfamily)